MFIRPIIIVLSLVFAMTGSAQEQSELTLTRMDELEVLFKDGRYLSYVTGNVPAMSSSRPGPAKSTATQPSGHKTNSSG